MTDQHTQVKETNLENTVRELVGHYGLQQHSATRCVGGPSVQLGDLVRGHGTSGVATRCDFELLQDRPLAGRTILLSE